MRRKPVMAPIVMIALLLVVALSTLQGAAQDPVAAPEAVAEEDTVLLRSAQTGEGCSHTTASMVQAPLPALSAQADNEELVPPIESCLNAIRPGARMSSPAGCTFNFVFREGDSLYIGTAAHCVGNPGQRVSAQGIGEIGSVAFNGWQGRPSTIENDFALIEIDTVRHSLVEPSMCTWGGPTGIGSPPGPFSQEALLEYGWGVATMISPSTRSRIHDEISSTSTILRWNGVGSGGDSGGPLLYGDGLAAGIHTAGLTPLAGAVLEQGPTIERVLTLAKDDGFDLELVTAKARWTMPV